ncbi:MAG: tail fiber domain-containing protein [Flavobacteriaceae bacterium]
MTATQRDAIATPAQGLVIYNTDTNQYNYWNSTTWIPLSAGGSSTLVDADGDTLVQVEESADEDIIRFDAGGTEQLIVNTNGIGVGMAPDTTVDIGINDNNTGFKQADSKITSVINGLDKLQVRNSETQIYNNLLVGNGNGSGTPAYGIDLSHTTLLRSNLYLDRFQVYRDANPSNGLGQSWMAYSYDNSYILARGSSEASWTDSEFILTNAGNITIDGSLTQNSDVRLKNNIMPLTAVLPKLMQLSGNRYTWRDQPESGTQIGLLAQEIEAQFPELVSTNKEMGGELEESKSVAYTNFTAVLLEGIKELKKEVDALKVRVAELERE